VRDDDRVGFIATLLLGPLSGGGPSAIKAEFAEKCTQLFEGAYGDPRGPEGHPCTCWLEHPRGDHHGGAVCGSTDKHDLGAPHFTV
jgi:hypothetical protein